MNIKSQLLNKNALIINNLAKEFLTKEEGDRINTVAEYAEKYSLARGTVQSALKFLCEQEAVAIDRRGHLGSFLTKIDYMKLLKVTDINFIVNNQCFHPQINNIICLWFSRVQQFFSQTKIRKS